MLCRLDRQSQPARCETRNAWEGIRGRGAWPPFPESHVPNPDRYILLKSGSAPSRRVNAAISREQLSRSVRLTISLGECM